MTQAQLLQALTTLLSQSAKPSKKSAKKPVKLDETARKDAFAQAIAKAFWKAGYGEIATGDANTYRVWESKGFRVKKGEHSIRVRPDGVRGKGYPFFHKSQVEPIVASVPQPKVAESQFSTISA